MEPTRPFIRRNVGILLGATAYACLGLTVLLAPSPGPRFLLPVATREADTLEFSPDGRVMVTEDSSGGACLRDVASGRVLAPLRRGVDDDPGPVNEIKCPHFTADGRRLVVQLGGLKVTRHETSAGSTSASVSFDLTIAVFDAATGREVVCFKKVGSTSGFRGMAVWQYALSADGSTLAFVRQPADRTSRIVVWDLEAGRTLADFPGSLPLALSPDGGVIAHDGGRRDSPEPTLRRLRPDRPPHWPPAGPSLVGSVSTGPVTFSLDGQWLAAVVYDSPPLRVNVPDALERAGLAEPGRPEPVVKIDPFLSQLQSFMAARFSRDARLLSVTRQQKVPGFTPGVQVWDLSGEAPRSVFQADARKVSLETDSAIDTELVKTIPGASGSNRIFRIKLVDLPSSSSRTLRIEPDFERAALTPDGRLVALSTGRYRKDDPSPAARFLASALNSVGIKASWLQGSGSSTLSRQIQFRDARTGCLVGSIDLGSTPLDTRYERFSPDGRSLVLSYSTSFAYLQSSNVEISKSIEVWDVPDGHPPGWVNSPAGAAVGGSLVLAGLVFDRRRRRRPGDGRDAAPSPVG